jgi:hypothetical protein
MSSDVTIGYQPSPTGIPQPIKIKAADRRGHTYLIGKTGTGKSTLAANMIIGDIRAGAGVGVIDPHGDLIDAIVRHIPTYRTNDVILFDPSDEDFPMGFNILEPTSDEDKQLAVSALVSVFRHLFRNSWGPRSEFILHNCAAALLDNRGPPTLLDIYRMLVDAEFRQQVADEAQDPIVQFFWTEVFATYNQRFANEVVSPLLNKVGQLLTGTYLRNIVGQPRSTINLQKILNNYHILLVRLPKGIIGEDRANLLGSALITKLYLAALERQSVSEGQRKDFYLYVDEYESFATDSFPSILSEARKYHLNLTLINQYLDQVPPDITKGIFGNVGNWIVFRVGATDAQVLEQEFQPYVKTEQLRRQGNHRITYKLMVDGVAAIPGTTTTPPPVQLQGDEADPQTIIRISRERYARPRAEVEKKILAHWGSSR